jgi:non-specific serine/threonine protein kinase
VLDGIDGLIDKSILRREEHRDTARYRMLETVRQYGQDRLAAADDLVRMRRRHRDWFRQVAGRFEADQLGPDQLGRIASLRGEHANLRAALDFCTADPAEAAAGLEIVHAIKEYWVLRGITEGRTWFSRLLEIAPSDAPNRVNCLCWYAYLALLQRDMPAVDAGLAGAAEIADRTGDPTAAPYIAQVRATAALIAGDGTGSAESFHTAMLQWRVIGNRGAELWAMYNYGLALAVAGEVSHSRQVLDDAVAAYGDRDGFWRCWALWARSAAEYLSGEFDQARQTNREVLRLQRLIGDRAVIAFSLMITAGCAIQDGDLRQAARLAGAAGAAWRSLGTSASSYGAFLAPLRESAAVVVDTLGTEEAGREFTVGAVLSLDDALTLALGADPTPTASPVPPGGKLTRREAQIAALVAEGLTNREIATRLVIAVRTAETHVDHILSKLNFTRRAQIAVWVVESRATER